MVESLPLVSTPLMRARRRFRSPMMSPWNSSGVMFSTFMIGSRRIGLAFFNASFKEKMAAILKASSFESTSW